MWFIPKKRWHIGRSERGFTLLELLIVVLIVGVLAAVAVPRYFKWINLAKVSHGFQGIRSIILYVESRKLVDADGNYPPSDGVVAAVAPDSVNFDYEYDGENVIVRGKAPTFDAEDTITYKLSDKSWVMGGDFDVINPPTQ